jgi:hypothetical protein
MILEKNVKFRQEKVQSPKSQKSQVKDNLAWDFWDLGLGTKFYLPQSFVKDDSDAVGEI